MLLTIVVIQCYMNWIHLIAVAVRNEETTAIARKLLKDGVLRRFCQRFQEETVCALFNCTLPTS